MTIEEIKSQLFKLSFEIDSYSAGRDYMALRRTHYDNEKWMADNGLAKEYYDYFFDRMRSESE